MDVRLLDSSQERASWRDVAKSIGSYSPDVVGITCTTATRFPAFRLAKMIKRIRRDATVIIGGPHVQWSQRKRSRASRISISWWPRRGSRAPNILEALAGKKRLPDMPGIFSREKGAISGSGFCPPVEDLAVLPCLPATSYRNTGTGKRECIQPQTRPSAGKRSDEYDADHDDRGCPFGCAFCSTRIFGQTEQNETGRERC